MKVGWSFAASAAFAMTVVAVNAFALPPSAAQPAGQPGAQPAGPQEGPHIRTDASHRLLFDHTHFIIHSARAAIAHKPLDIIDPQTKKPIDRNKEYKVNGQMVKGAEIIKNYNLMEQYLNQYGLSNATAAPVNQLGALNVDTEFEKANHERLHTQVTPPSPQAEQHMAQAGKPLPQTAQAPKAKPKPFTFDRTWTYDKKAGNGKNGLDVGAGFDIHVADAKQRTEAKAYLTGVVLGHGFDILRADAFAEADESGPKGTAHAGAKLTTIQGKELWSKAYDNPNTYTANGSFPVYKFNWSPKFPTAHIPIGPFEITVDVGAKLALGVDVKYALHLLSARADGVPHGTFDADIKAGVGFALAHAGVGGNINLLQDQFTLGGSAVLVESADGQKVSLNLNIFGKNHLEGLSGRLYAWAKAGVDICCGCCEKEWHIDIAKWGAPLKLDTRVFEWDQPIVIYPVHSGVGSGGGGGGGAGSGGGGGHDRDPAPVLRDLRRFDAPNGTSFVSTGAALPPGYTHAHNIGKVESGHEAGMKPLYACVYTVDEKRIVHMPKMTGMMMSFEHKEIHVKKANGVHFESLNPTCDGHKKTGIVAWVWDKGGRGKHEVFHCHTAAERSFISLDPNCEKRGKKEMSFFVAN